MFGSPAKKETLILPVTYDNWCMCKTGKHQSVTIIGSHCYSKNNVCLCFRWLSDCIVDNVSITTEIMESNVGKRCFIVHTFFNGQIKLTKKTIFIKHSNMYLFAFVE